MLIHRPGTNHGSDNAGNTENKQEPDCGILRQVSDIHQNRRDVGVHRELAQNHDHGQKVKLYKRRALKQGRQAL